MPTREEIVLLEPFCGLTIEQIQVPVTDDQFAAAVSEIQAAGAVGFDTETKPVFVRGATNEGPDLVQFATEHRAFLFQLHRLVCRPYLIELLQSVAVMKIGFDLTSDRSLLQHKLGVETQGIIDLSRAFRQRGYRQT
ncbi:MAG TPA: 3'-5' exonuclease domain-containing protein 2, partial [Candidatus Ozemobacteraceae bacterium]|nr:3'-5' exonuclease domain-containing protein 2 [Candidatus Ozemobacteraceae bacterium]